MPSEIDDVWHTHLLHTQSYHDMCNVFGMFIHHNPLLGNDRELRQQRLEYMKHIYHETFGDIAKPHTTYPDPEYMIFVRFGGKTHTVNISGEYTIHQVLCAFSDKSDLYEHSDICRLRCLYGGKQLEYNYYVKDYNIKKEATLDIMFKLRGC